MKLEGATGRNLHTASVEFTNTRLCYLDNTRCVFSHGETEGHYDSPRNVDKARAFLEFAAPKEAETLRTISTRAAAVFMFCMALAPSLRAQDTSCHPRLISLTGTAEIKVAPDEVALTLALDSRDKD